MNRNQSEAAGPDWVSTLSTGKYIEINRRPKAKDGGLAERSPYMKSCGCEAAGRDWVGTRCVQ